MTFTWNVPGGTAEPALVVRADAPPGDVARAALSLLDSILEQAAEALDGPEMGDLRLDDEGDDLVLVIAGEENWYPHVSVAWPKLAALGITLIRWVHAEEREYRPLPTGGWDGRGPTP